MPPVRPPTGPIQARLLEERFQVLGLIRVPSTYSHALLKVDRGLKGTTAQAQIAAQVTTTAPVGTSIPIRGLLARAAHVVVMVAAELARYRIRPNLNTGVDHEGSLQTR